jgi:hypothetical protein
MTQPQRDVVDRPLDLLLSALAILGAVLCLVGWYRWAT